MLAIEAEQSLLGILLKEGDLIKEITLQEKHFYERRHRILFKTLRAIEQKGEPVDIVTVITTMGQSDLSVVGGKKYLGELMNSVASLEAIHTYEKYILDAWKIREAQAIKEQGIHSLDDISNTMNRLSELEQENQ